MKSTADSKLDVALVERVREALSQVPAVTEKRMFGSIAFMVRGKMCVTARAERIMCRIAPSLHDTAVARPGCQTVVMRGRQYRGYVYVAAEALKTKREFEILDPSRAGPQ